MDNSSFEWIDEFHAELRIFNFQRHSSCDISDSVIQFLGEKHGFSTNLELAEGLLLAIQSLVGPIAASRLSSATTYDLEKTTV